MITEVHENEHPAGHPFRKGDKPAYHDLPRRSHICFRGRDHAVHAV